MTTGKPNCWQQVDRGIICRLVILSTGCGKDFFSAATRVAGSRSAWAVRGKLIGDKHGLEIVEPAS